MTVNSIGKVRNNFEYNIDIVMKINTNTPYSVWNLQNKLGLFVVNISIIRKNLCFSKVSGLVGPWVIICSVAIYNSLNTLPRITLQTLCNHKFIYLTWGWLTWWMASTIAAWLKALKSTVFKSRPSYLSFFKLPANNTNSFLLLHSPIYLALGVEFAAVAWRLRTQLTSLLSRKKI